MLAVTTARLSLFEQLHFPEGAVKHLSGDTSIARDIDFCPQNDQAHVPQPRQALKAAHRPSLALKPSSEILGPDIQYSEIFKVI